ncbi:hypothetical protein RJ639_000833 [Escallonia herrerae]|uniref:Uncharacterized protein n=1 Tax=Escallonia herrerae TaxID=1293975 RepID=A0AA88XAF3_9ASTE|nr:hypothetical protein RJ639_000833 [Escallonia herrerae]
MPLHLSMIRPAETTTASSQISSPDTPKSRRRTIISGSDPYLFSPKAPRCSSRWKELLGLKKLYHSSNVKQDNNHKAMSSSAPSHALSTAKSLKHFLHRSSKSTGAALDSSLSLPLLKDTDNESVSISSSSSGHDHDDLPRLSLDSDKPQKSLNLNPTSNPPRIRLVKPRAVSMDNAAAARVSRSPLRRQPESANATGRGVSVDSPRMNSSGKIVFHSLERSSSSPSSFNGGPRFKHRGMERSYSANVRVTPVLNVPVCSLRGSSKFGFPMFSSQQKRDGGAGVGNGGGSRSQHSNNSKNRRIELDGRINK